MPGNRGLFNTDVVRGAGIEPPFAARVALGSDTPDAPGPSPCGLLQAKYSPSAWHALGRVRQERLAKSARWWAKRAMHASKQLSRAMIMESVPIDVASCAMDRVTTARAVRCQTQAGNEAQ